MEWVAVAIFLLVAVLMHIYKVSLVYVGTDEAKYDRAMFGILLRK